MSTQERIEVLRAKAKELEEEARSLETSGRLEAERAREEARAKRRVFYWENPGPGARDKQQHLEVLVGEGKDEGKIVFEGQQVDYEGGPVPLPLPEVDRLIEALVRARRELSKLSAEEQQALLALWKSKNAATEMAAAMLERLSGPGFILRVGMFTYEEGVGSVFKFREPSEWVVSYEGVGYLVREGFVKQVYADATSGWFEPVNRPEGP